MSIVKRGKYWHYEFRIEGRKYRGSTHETKEAKAKTYESLYRAKVVEAGSTMPVRKAPTLYEFSKRFLAYVDDRVAANDLDTDTQRHYKNGWRMLSATPIVNRKIDQIAASDVAVLSFPGGAWSARAAQQVLGRMLNLAVEWNLMKAAPRIKRTKAVGRSARIEPWMEAELIRHMDRDCADVFCIMLDCGMRPDEVLRMRWENVLWSEGMIFVPKGKTAASRRNVPLANRTRELLRAREQGTQSPWVFPGKSANGRRTTIAKKFEEAREAVGIRTSVVLYCARHEFATTYLEHGGDLATLKKIMGHTSITTTEKYLHPGMVGAADLIDKRNRTRGLHVVKKESA